MRIIIKFPHLDSLLKDAEYEASLRDAISDGPRNIIEIPSDHGDEIIQVPYMLYLANRVSDSVLVVENISLYSTHLTYWKLDIFAPLPATVLIPLVDPRPQEIINEFQEKMRCSRLFSSQNHILNIRTEVIDKYFGYPIIAVIMRRHPDPLPLEEMVDSHILKRIKVLYYSIDNTGMIAKDLRDLL